MLRRNSVILLGTFCILFIPSMISGSFSYFQTTQLNQGNIFTVDNINNYLSALPGSAVATFPAVGNPNGETHQVAFFKNGELMLDFGEVVPGYSKNFNNVLILCNTCGITLKGSWQIEGQLKSVMDATGGTFTLSTNKDNSYSLDLKLKVTDSIGSYSGYLILKVNGDFLTMRIPAKVVVR